MEKTCIIVLYMRNGYTGSRLGELSFFTAFHGFRILFCFVASPFSLHFTGSEFCFVANQK